MKSLLTLVVVFCMTVITTFAQEGCEAIEYIENWQQESDFHGNAYTSQKQAAVDYALKIVTLAMLEEKPINMECLAQCVSYAPDAIIASDGLLSGRTHKMAKQYQLEFSYWFCVNLIQMNFGVTQEQAAITEAQELIPVPEGAAKIFNFAPECEAEEYIATWRNHTTNQGTIFSSNKDAAVYYAMQTLFKTSIKGITVEDQLCLEVCSKYEPRIRTITILYCDDMLTLAQECNLVEDFYAFDAASEEYKSQRKVELALVNEKEDQVIDSMIVLDNLWLLPDSILDEWAEFTRLDDKQKTLVAIEAIEYSLANISTDMMLLEFGSHITPENRGIYRGLGCNQELLLVEYYEGANTLELRELAKQFFDCVQQ